MIVNYRYGFDNITFNCEKSGEDLKTWQISVEAFPKDVFSDINEFQADWEDRNPSSTYRKIIQ